MKRTLLLIIIATLCYSFQTSVTVAKPKVRVKLLTNLISNQTTEYFYDPSGHITRIKSSNGNEISYEYLSGKMILRRYNEIKRGTSFVDTMMLNKNGLVEKIISSNPAIITQTHEYNKDKNLILNTYVYPIKDSITFSHNSYEYQNGNEVSNILKETTGEIRWITKSTYYTDKTNTIGNENLGSDFVGTSSKNPIKSFVSGASGQEMLTTNYNYHYDDKGRIIIKASYALKTGKLTDSVAYSYY